MRSPLAIIRERRDREGADAAYWEDLARELRPDPTPEPVPLEQLCTECGARHRSDNNTLCGRFTPVTDDDVDQALDRLETGGNMIDDLLAKLGEDTDPGPLELGPIHGPPAPVPLPAGAVRNRQDVYTDGNRCGECGAATTLEVCVKCTIGATP